MKTALTLSALITACFALSQPAQATDHSKPAVAAKPASAAELTDGEVKKVDKDNKKLTIKHGEIKNLDMPPMTMVFQVKDPAMIDRVKVGDKIRFAAEKSASGFFVTEIAPAGK